MMDTPRASRSRDIVAIAWRTRLGRVLGSSHSGSLRRPATTAGEIPCTADGCTRVNPGVFRIGQFHRKLGWRLKMTARKSVAVGAKKKTSGAGTGCAQNRRNLAPADWFVNE